MPHPKFTVLCWLLASVGLGSCQRSVGGEAARGASARLAALPPVAADQLRPVAAFSSLPEGAEQSRALFAEASRVLLHPRCVNCHMDGDWPGQGDASLQHEPPVARGLDDKGVVGMQCDSCHQDRNLALARVPGAPNWHLAPLGMAWIHKSPRELCEQLQDRARNGKRSLEQIVEHSNHDALVAWGWEPGADREPAPGTQPQFGALMEAWVASGAECPLAEEGPSASADQEGPR